MFHWGEGGRQSAEVFCSALGSVKPSVSLNLSAQSSSKEAVTPRTEAPELHSPVQRTRTMNFKQLFGQLSASPPCPDLLGSHRQGRDDPCQESSVCKDRSLNKDQDSHLEQLLNPRGRKGPRFLVLTPDSAAHSHPISQSGPRLLPGKQRSQSDFG